MLLLGLWDSVRDLISAMMQPLYWVVSGLVVLFHKLWLPVFNHEGWAWTMAIITLTVVIRTALIPLFVKQINSARNMQLVQPKLKAIQEKYGHDRERAGQEMMKLYKEEGVNPTASCLPLLLQMPIFLALFRVLEGASRGIPRGSFFKNNPELMTSLQNADIFGAKLAARFLPMDPFGATQILCIVLAVAMTVVLFITQLQLMRKNMPPEALTGPLAQQQKMMLYLFPAMYLFSGLYIPIGVLIYWLTSNLWTMVQQYILIHNNPSPNTPAYVDWQERMRAKGIDPDELEQQRREKRLGRVKPTEAKTVIGDDGVERATVARQGVTRQTVRRTSDGGRQVVQRQQPNRQTRSARKK
ncbi:membrane protein insertase YidC [Aestuariimicrobium ganziense]|uniref:membrane protein insertase YidC n=1 Tax=Aestuariimicrobium ganziense TaxID=2773677 RepID=UPI001941B253|nr:membrane protein insertase YidC [Aestuariimicrobium ganziense]